MEYLSRIFRALMKPCKVCGLDYAALCHYGVSEEGLEAHAYQVGEA